MTHVSQKLRLWMDVNEPSLAKTLTLSIGDTEVDLPVHLPEWNSYDEGEKGEYIDGWLWENCSAHPQDDFSFSTSITGNSVIVFFDMDFELRHPNTGEVLCAFTLGKIMSPVYCIEPDTWEGCDRDVQLEYVEDIVWDMIELHWRIIE